MERRGNTVTLPTMTKRKKRSQRGKTKKKKG